VPDPVTSSVAPARVEVIAEIANAHQGDPAAAVQLARAAAAAGADAVKFQVYFADELLTPTHPRFAHFRQQAFGEDVWLRLLRDVRSLGARVYCDVFGLRALAIAAEAGADGYKVHSSDLGNEPLLAAVARTRLPILLAVGGSTIREIARAVRAVAAREGPRPVLLHGFQSYPTAVEDSTLSRLTWFAELFGDVCDVGYMDHVDADDPLAVCLPVLAIGLGARVIEKHVTLDRAAKGVDYYSSLNPGEFADFVRTIRRCETAFGREPARFVPAERTYRLQMKKHWVTRHPLTAGAVLGPDDVVMKRADSAADVPELDHLLGRTVAHELPANHVLSRADVHQRVWALVVARMQSSRLPAKAVVDVGGMPALAHLFQRIGQARRVDRIVLCTTRDAADDRLADLAKGSGIDVYRGEGEDVLARMLGAVAGQGVDVALRVTGDDILVDPEYVDRAIAHHLAVNAEYTDLKALPSGTEVEVFDVGLLQTLATLAFDSSGTEYLTAYVVDHRDQFRTTSAPVDEGHRRQWRLTLDTPEDLEVISRLLQAMAERGKALAYRLDDIVDYFTGHPDVLALNAAVRGRGTPPAVRTELLWQRLLQGAGTESLRCAG